MAEQKNVSSSEHIFLLPFYYECEAPDEQDAERYFRLLLKEKEWCDAWTPKDRAVAYARWEYLSNEARGIFPDLSLNQVDARGICNILRWWQDDAQNNTYQLIREKTWTLDVLGLELHIYRHGVAILVLHTANRTYPDLADIQKIADFGRRLRQPNFPGKEKNGLSADTVKLMLNGQTYTAELFQQIKETVESENTTAPTPHFLWDLVSAPGIQITPVADDRMFEMELVYDENLSQQIKGSHGPWRENGTLEQQLYSLVFCDKGDPTCQDSIMRRELLQKTVDPRWADYGTLYAASEYSFLCVTGSNKDARDFVGPNFLTQYLYMVSLVLAQRMGLIRFAERAGALDYRMRKGKFAKHLNALSADFSNFQMQMLISRFSDQDQGIELYELLQKQLRVEQYRDKINSQLQGVFENASLNMQQKQNTRIAVFASILGVIQIAIAVWQVFCQH
ncbi:MAG: hypothetical protein K5990_08170 [Oscillospiraceae bacterium]|nr:hypothetical protein [Oscillospiraceae bacterium]